MNYATATVQEMHQVLVDGTATPADLLAEARRVIGERDGEIHAFITSFETADDDAARALDMIRAGRATPLTGIPVAVKDNICIKDRPVTAASAMLRGFVSPYDATVIACLREHGAVIVGQTNMDEFAMGSSTEHSVYGPTGNPHDTRRVPGGSSGGSAAAVAMGAVPLALGSDTGGSVRQPAAFCGTVGLKPTYGSVSRHGLIALGSSLDVIGTFARTVGDTEIIFNALRGAADSYDSTLGIYDGMYTDADEKILGVPDTLETVGIPPETMSAFSATVRSMERDGWTVRPVSLPMLEHAGSVYYIIQPAEASSNLARYDGVRYGAHVDGDDVWGDYIRTRGAKFGDEVLRRIIIGTHVLSAGYYDAYYRKATEARDAMRRSFLAALGEVNAVALPTAPDTAFVRGERRDPVAMYAEDRLTLQANLTGLPAVSVPMRTDGLPRGIQFIAGYGNERMLFTCAAAVERSG